MRLVYVAKQVIRNRCMRLEVLDESEVTGHVTDQGEKPCSTGFWEMEFVFTDVVDVTSRIQKESGHKMYSC